MTDQTQFDYLLNAFEQASQSDKPADLDYAGKRKALYAYVRGLESERDKVLEEAAQTCESLNLCSRESADWQAGTLDCAYAIRAIKSQQPAQPAAPKEPTDVP